jgi:hypothetical protein
VLTWLSALSGTLNVCASFLSDGLTGVVMEVPALITGSLCTFKTAVAQLV